MFLSLRRLIPRVADTLYNPFGEDDDDFELNELINRSVRLPNPQLENLTFTCTSLPFWLRHFRVGMSIVDSTKPAPPLRRDVFWDQVLTSQLFLVIGNCWGCCLWRSEVMVTEGKGKTIHHQLGFCGNMICFATSSIP